MVPPPDAPHDEIDARLVKSLARHLIEMNVEGDILHPRAAIYTDLTVGNYLEPDMMYVSSDLKKRMGAKRSSADIVFEYLSRSNAIYDRTTKADTYLALGVCELWLVDPSAMTIEVRYAIRAGGQPACESWLYSPGDRAESRLLEGWSVSVEEFFDGLV